MELAFEDDVFAVVDLETTGTQRLQHDRIIQFGCALIKHRWVVKTYSFLINPQRRIPTAVENLTGIKNADVKGQPVFAHFAKRIRKILAGTIFVAHNVNFDLPFLNYELDRAGLAPLTGKAVDTVELAQILFPTYPSYKLRDLTAHLKIKHLNPHRADSDALVTAKLLLKIIAKIETLPQVTLSTLTALSKGLLRDTNYIFEAIADKGRHQKRPLAKSFQQVRNIVLKKKPSLSRANPGRRATFPVNDQDKKKLFRGHLRYRRAQVALINRLHQFWQNEQEKDLLIEAPNGTGKSFSYLFSAAYELYGPQKLVIATPTQVLQQQLLEHEIPQLLQVTGLDLTVQVVKSPSHYLDLDGFVNSLYQTSDNQQTLLLQMGILVWLTETDSGDLDELQLTSYQAPLFDKIRHPGDARVGTAFSQVDFWNRARARAEQADILVTNHAYLANNYLSSIWGSKPYLIVDEAHRFIDSVASSRTDQLRLESLWGALSHLRNVFFFAPNCIANRFGDSLGLDFILQKLDPEIVDTIQRINVLQKLLYSRRQEALSRQSLPNQSLELSFQGKTLFADKETCLDSITAIQRGLNNVRQLLTQAMAILYDHQKEGLPSEFESTNAELSDDMDHLDYYVEQLYQLAGLVKEPSKLAQTGFILIITNAADQLSTNIGWLLLDPAKEAAKIYQHFAKCLFVSATLSSNGSFAFMKQELALPKDTPSYSSPASFKMNKRLQVMAVHDQQVPADPNSQEFEQFIESFLKKMPLVNDHILVLFTNLGTIRNVFEQIGADQHFKDYEFLAQGVTGSNQRLAKRFAIAKKAILLGANTFWEGVDFNHAEVDLAIVTKLPFESPDQPEVRLRQENLNGKVKSLFNDDLLPRAVIKFRQGCGRLIRNERDHGCYVVLDQRLFSRSYGSSFLASLPVTCQTGKLKTAFKKLSTKETDHERRK